MTIHAFAEYQRIMILPAFWLEAISCDCCRGGSICVGVGWLFWGVGVGFHAGGCR